MQQPKEDVYLVYILLWVLFIIQNKVVFGGADPAQRMFYLTRLVNKTLHLIFIYLKRPVKVYQLTGI